MSGGVAAPAEMFDVFVQGVQAKAAPLLGSVGEEVLTESCCDLLEAMMTHLGVGGLTIVHKAAVEMRTGSADDVRVGFPDLQLYDKLGRLTLCVELKAPGTGADPTSFTGRNQDQWERYRNLPNLVYTDGNDWTLWHSGQRSSHYVEVCDDILAPGAVAGPDPQAAMNMFRAALTWQPPKIRSSKQLASTCAKHCRILRDQLEGLDAGHLKQITADWRELLFPEISHERFIDAYAQTVTFALVTAGSLGIEMQMPLPADKYDRLDLQLHHIASKLEKRRGLLGKALSLLTGSAEVRDELRVYLEVLVSVVSAVDWEKVRGSKNAKDTSWLHFYEHFLTKYDSELRKQSGSYYTPRQIVDWMTRFTHKILASSLKAGGGFANNNVTVVDPAVGTGTFLLSVLDRITEHTRTQTKRGRSAVPAKLSDAVDERLIGFEIQSGPYAVAQLRLAEHLRAASGDKAPTPRLRIYLNDTLSDHADHQGEGTQVPMFFKPIAESRAAANKIKREEPVVVVIGNPPYLQGAAGKGGWVEEKLIADWRPPKSWAVSSGHTKELANLYVYFWRWATWQVFEKPGQADDDDDKAGVVSFIAPTAFLTGAGFQKMREWLRRRCSEIWVLHLSPEGHHASTKSQIFPTMQQPVAIVTAVRASQTDDETPATVRFHMVPSGTRGDKIKHIAELADPGHTDWKVSELPPRVAADDWRAPFTPPPEGAWGEMVPVHDLFPWHGSGVKAARTWPIAPDKDILRERWQKLISVAAKARNVKAKRDKKKAPDPALDKALEQAYEAVETHYDEDNKGDIHKKIKEDITDKMATLKAIIEETSNSIETVPYGYRSFDRQWIIRDRRVVSRPNPSLWPAHSNQQIYLKVPAMSTDGTRSLIAKSPGAIVSFSEAIPDMHYLSGSRAGRVHPLWRDGGAREPNVSPGLLNGLSSLYGQRVGAEDLFAYVAAVAAHPGYTNTFREHLRLATELRIPVTTDAKLFAEAAELGREIIRLHTYNRRFATDPQDTTPTVPDEADPPTEIPSQTPLATANAFSHDPKNNTLIVHGAGTNGNPRRVEITNVTADMYDYTTGTMNVLESWFKYRMASPPPPPPRRKKPPSPLDAIHASEWDSGPYPEQLLELLHVLRLLTDLHEHQQGLLTRIAAHPLADLAQLRQGVKKADQQAANKPPLTYREMRQPSFPGTSEGAEPSTEASV